MVKKVKKIAFLLKPEIGIFREDYLGGTERVFIQDITTLSKEGLRINVFARVKIDSLPKNCHPFKLYYPKFLAEILLFLETKLHSFLVQELIQLLKELFNLFFAFEFILKSKKDNILYVFQTPIVAIFEPEKTIINFHTTNEKIFLFKIFRKRYLKSNFVFCSYALKRHFLRCYPDLKNANTKVIYNSIDYNLFRPIIRNRNKKITFLYASDWSKIKGLSLFLKAIERIEKKTTNFQVLIAGSEDLWYSDYMGERNDFAGKIEIFASKLKTVKIVKKINYKNMPALYNKADCLVFPSLWPEPFGLVILEALACGTPVLGFRTGGIPEIVNHNTNGILLPHKTLKSLVSEMEKIIKNPILLSKLKRNTRKFVLEKFSSDKRENEINNLFNIL